LGDREAVRTALTVCVDGGAAPFAVIATVGWILDDLRTDAEIAELLDRLYDVQADSRSAGAQ
jgi:hypothetical protein